MSSKKLHRLTQLGFILIVSIGFAISLGWWLSSDEVKTAVAAPAHQSSDPTDEVEVEEVNSSDEEVSSPAPNDDNSAPRSGERDFVNALASLPPVVTDESYETDEDTSLLITATTGILANDTDPEGMTLTAVYAGDPLWGDLSLDSDGGFTYTPTADFDGTDNFDYIVSDDTFIFYEGFEDTGDATYQVNTNPIPGAPNVAYGVEIEDDGRLRTQISAAFVRTGTHGATLDRDTNAASNQTNYLTVTVDMSAYTVATDTIVLDFSWMDHGEEDNTPDRVWVRGADSDGWLEIYDFTANRDTDGTNRDTADLAVSQLLLNNGQDFSSTFQIRFGQRDDSYASTKAGLAGITIDDIILRWADTSYTRGNATITVNSVNDTPVAANDTYTTSEDTPLIEPANTAYLETTFNSTDSGIGNMFDVTATSDIMITAFDVHLNTTSEDRIEIYYKSGTYEGSENTPTDWTLLDEVAVIGAGSGNATYVPITPLEIPAGTTIGFYIQVTEGSLMRYTNSNQTYTNGDLEIGAGARLYLNWGIASAPYNWNGRIYYKTDGVLYNDSDPDHDTLTALLGSEPGNGEVALNSDGSFVYTPTQDFSGSDSFTYYTLDDAETIPVVGYWPFSEGSGSSSADESGNGLTASLLNGPTFSTTVPITPTFSNTYALAFDGGDDRVTMADSSDINSGTFPQRTVTAWFKADDVSISSRKQIIWEEGGTTNGLNIYLYDGTLYAGAWSSNSSWSGTWITSSAIISGQWHHVALVLDSYSTSGAEADAMHLYLDGQWASSGTGAQLGNHVGDIGIGNQDNDTKFHTGTSSGDGGHGLAGLIDEVQVYNLVLTQSQIQTLMSTDLPGLWDLATVTLNVTAVNDAPTAVNDNYAVAETIATTISAPGVLDNDSDVDGDVITAVIDSLPANGTIVLALDGGFTYTPTGGFSGIDTFSYIVDDGALTDTGMVTLTVQNYCYAQVDSSGTVYESVDGGAVQEAVDAAQTDDLIKVAGNCVGTQTRAGETQTVYISQSLTIQGGYTNTDWITQNTTLYTTTLDAEQNGRVAYIPAGVTVTLSSLTLQNAFMDANGGGIYNEGELTIEDSVIQNNISDGSRGGGGVYSEAGSVTITDSDFIENDSTTWTGGAFYIIDTTFSLMNSTVISNTALQSGGGFALWNDSPSVISGTTVAGNTSTNGGGAAFFIGDVLGVALYDTTIENNSSDNQCAAINNQEGIVTIYSSIITGNSVPTGNETGIICNLSFTSDITVTMVISESEISNNSVLYGPGVVQFVTNGSYDVEIVDTVIDANSGGGGEGTLANFGSGTLMMEQVVIQENDEVGVYNDGGTVTIVDSAVISNSSIITGAGAGIVNISGAISLENSTVSNNSAIGSGGGIWNDATLDMNHVTIANNSDGLYNNPTAFAAQAIQSRTPSLVGIYASSDEEVIETPKTKTVVSLRQPAAGTATIANSIIADNTDGDCSGDAPTSGDYNLDSDGSCSFNQTNDLSATDPLLAAVAQNLGLQTTWTQALYDNSPALDTIPQGINGCGTTYITDQRGEARPSGNSCDVGAYEAPSGICSIETTGDDVTDYASDDASALQTAVNAANADDLIKVAGTCAGVQVQGGLTQTVYISQNLTIQGGYTNTNWLLSDPESYPTTIDAEGNGTVAYIADNADVTLENLILTGGNSSTDGGGVYVENNAALTISYSTVNNNSTSGNGGGISNYGSLSIVSSAILDNSTSGSQPDGRGGGIENQGLLTITNSTLSGNSATSGGAVFNGATTVTITHSTIVSNSASNTGGGILIAGGPPPPPIDAGYLYLSNSILAYNSGGDCALGGGGLVSLNVYSLIEDGSCGHAGLTGDPQLADLADNGGSTQTYALLSGSPAVDAGEPIYAGQAGDYDQRGVGYDRVQNGRLDIGAYEMTAYSLTTILAGSGGGSVSSNPIGIACESDCSGSYLIDTVVTLTAVYSPNSTFTGWTGAISTTNNPITLTMNAAKSVTATFTLDTHDLTVAVDGTGNGSVSSDPTGISCGADCNEVYDYGTMVTLTAVSTIGSTFTSWTGAISSTDNPLTLTVDAAKSVTATFTLDTHDLTVAVDGTGGGSVSSNPSGISCESDCSEAYDYGTAVTLTATAAAGSSFTGWDGACTGIGDCMVTMSEAKAVTATFTLGTNALTVLTDGTGTGSITGNPSICGVDCSTVFDYGTVVTLTAISTTGSTFTGWTGAIVSTDNPITLTMDAAKSVTATFTLDTHDLAVNLDGNGSVSSDPSGISCESDCSETFDYGTMVTLTAVYSPNSTFTGWTGAISTTNNPITLTIDAAKSVTATFTLDTHDLTVNLDGNGSVSSDPSGINCESDCSEAFDYGTVVTLTAVSTISSTFTGWTGVISTTNNPITLTMDAAKSVTATFTLDTHDLTINLDGNGTVSSDPAGISCEADCSETYDYGTAVTLTATAAAGSSFTGWDGACTGISDCVVTMSEAKAVTATFTLGTNALTVLTDGTGTGSVTGNPSICGVDCSTVFDYGTVVTLTAVSDVDSTFAGWSGGGCSGTDVCVVTMTAAQSVTATFMKTEFYIYLPVILK